MKSRTLSCITAMTLIAALTIPVRLAAQDQTGEEHHSKHYRYKLVDIGTFGGPASGVNFTVPGVNSNYDLNSRGMVVGSAATSIPTAPTSNFLFICGFVPFVVHTFEWQKGLVTDLGALPPADKNCSGPLSINANGEIVGVSENGVIDPLTGITEGRAVLWRDGEITNLGTLGGNNSNANVINNRGQVVGMAQNAIPDPFAYFGLGTQCRAFLWQNGVMQDLGTLGGPDAWAFFVNGRGQIAGASFTNSTPNPATGAPTQDPFLWEDGRMIDLGTLGGTSGFPFALNNRGQVVGISNLAGDTQTHAFFWDKGTLTDLGTPGGTFAIANGINDAGEIVGGGTTAGDLAFHALIWRRGVLTNLGTVGGDGCSQAFAINSGGQVVGQSFSCDGSTVRAFLWENGSMVDLNTRIPPNSALQLVNAVAINDRGEITGLGVPPGVSPANVDTLGRAFVLIASGEDDAEGAISVSQNDPAPVTQNSTNVTEARLTPEMLSALRARFARRYRGFGTWPGR